MFAAGLPGPGAPQLKTKKALLLIDLQIDFVLPGGKLFVPNTRDFLPKLPALIRQFRSKGDVFFITTAFTEPRSMYCDATGGPGLILKRNVASRQPSVVAENLDGCSDGHASTLPAEASCVITEDMHNEDVEAFLSPPCGSQASRSQCCIPGSMGVSMPHTLALAFDPTVDTAISKSHYSPFQDPSFLLQLRMQLVTELYVCGSLSNISVYATVLDAVSHGMSVTVVEDCVGYRDEGCHREAMRQMADSLGANGIDYQELMDDLAGLLGDVIHEEDFKTQYDVAFQRGLQSKGKSNSKQETSAWLSSLEEPASEVRQAGQSSSEPVLHSARSVFVSARNAEHNTEPLADTGSSRQKSSESPPRKRQSDDQEPDARGSKSHSRRRASHEGHLGDRSLNKPKQSRSRHLYIKEHCRSPSHRQEDRPHIESKSTGDIPLAASAEPGAHSSMLQDQAQTGQNDESIAARMTSRSGPQPRESARRSRRSRTISSSDVLGPRDTIAADSFIICDVLPEDVSSTIFNDLNTEVSWQKMYHLSGEVPRLVAVQGETTSFQIPIYRHPADSSPPLLPFTSHVQIIREAAEKLVGHPLNHALIQLYRTPEDNISEHSDKTLDIVRGSRIVNYSAGALRTMILRCKKSAILTQDVDVKQAEDVLSSNITHVPPRPALRVPIPHNSLFVLGPETNRSHLHSIRADKRRSVERSEAERAFNGSRISLTFRHIGTFVNPQINTIWGQGATSKTIEEAKKIVAGQQSGEDFERMIKAFGQENRLSNSWNWDEHYGCGFDVVDSHKNPSDKDCAATGPNPAGESIVPVKAKSTSRMTLGPGMDLQPDFILAGNDACPQAGSET